MKNLLLTIFILLSMHLSAEIKNNAYIYFDRKDMSESQICLMTEMQMCIIMNGHYYTAPIPEHSIQCPCLIEDCALED